MHPFRHVTRLGRRSILNCHTNKRKVLKITILTHGRKLNFRIKLIIKITFLDSQAEWEIRVS